MSHVIETLRNYSHEGGSSNNGGGSQTEKDLYDKHRVTHLNRINSKDVIYESDETTSTPEHAGIHTRSVKVATIYEQSSVDEAVVEASEICQKIKNIARNNSTESESSANDKTSADISNGNSNCTRNDNEKDIIESKDNDANNYYRTSNFDMINNDNNNNINNDMMDSDDNDNNKNHNNDMILNDNNNNNNNDKNNIKIDDANNSKSSSCCSSNKNNNINENEKTSNGKNNDHSTGGHNSFEKHQISVEDYPDNSNVTTLGEGNYNSNNNNIDNVSPMNNDSFDFTSISNDDNKLCIDNSNDSENDFKKKNKGTYDSDTIVKDKNILEPKPVLDVNAVVPLNTLYKLSNSCGKQLDRSDVGSAAPMTHYERAMNALVSDYRVRKDVNLGRRVGLYRIGMKVGAGTYSVVKLATNVLTKDTVAVKIINKLQMDHKGLALLSQEICCMKHILHEHIITLFGVIESPTKVHLVMEFASGGDLFRKILSHGPLKEDKGAAIFKQILSALEYMHDRNIVHRDIKPENILLSSKNVDHIKLADLGFSVKLECADDLLDCFCGSPPYAAPELFLCQRYNGFNVDIWALGILLYYIHASYPPFIGDCVPTIKRRVLHGKYRDIEGTSKELHTLIASILVYDPEKRISLARIQMDDWFHTHNLVSVDDVPGHSTDSTQSWVKQAAGLPAIPHSSSAGAILSEKERSPSGNVATETRPLVKSMEIYRFMLRNYGTPIDEVTGVVHGAEFSSPLMGIYRLTEARLVQSRIRLSQVDTMNKILMPVDVVKHDKRKSLTRKISRLSLAACKPQSPVCSIL